MIALFTILCLGFFLGMRHATDADHVVAVTTIVSQQRNVRGAALTGLFWGLGHSLTLLVVGGAIVAFGIVIPERLGLSFEFSVAVMLILLGVLNVRAMFRWSDRLGGERPHRHEGDALSAKFEARFGKSRTFQSIRPMIIGVVHGLAGSAAVALLVLPMIQNTAWAIGYLLVFGTGTIAGMMIATVAISLPFTFADARSQLVRRYLGATAGFGSIGFGCFLVYQIGFAGGLFVR